MATRMISIDEIPDAVFIVDRDGTIVTVSAAVHEFFGYEPAELIGQKIEILVPGRYRNHAEIRERYLANPRHRPMGNVQQIFGARKDGSEVPIDIALRPVPEDGTTICIVRDISEHVRLSDQIREIAYRDMVTGALNRRAFFEELTRMMSDPAARGPGTCIAFFDLDDFKDVNDTLGHNCGDCVLAEFCVRMHELMNGDMSLFRIGGDEFALIIPDCPDQAKGRSFVDTAIRMLRRPYTVEGHRIAIGCSAGIVHAPTDGATAEELISNAGLALDEAKAARGVSHVFTPSLRDAVEQRFALLTELRNAGESGQFQLHFQPQVDIRSGAVVGAEALMRWEHPTRGLLQPGEFIDVLSDSELSVSIGRWALFEACRHAAAWQAKADRPIRIAVNLFPWQVKTREFFNDVREALQSAGLDASLLELELTENTIIESSDEFIAILGAVRDQGVNIALDDFGTGFASLNSLTRFPINTIKIDRSFVRDVGSGKGNWPVLRTMPKLARDLGLTIVAEGVETAEDAMMIQHFGYDYGQGYYWGKAAKAEDFCSMLEHGLAEKPPVRNGEFPQVRISAIEDIVKRRFPMFG